MTVPAPADAGPAAPPTARRQGGAISLRSVDLNLLVVFDALVSERHVTRAAHRIGITQPAMSNALARLRRLFGDELFIRGPWGMEPTARALELADGVTRLLRQTERLFVSDARFDPGSSTRVFTGRMSDLVGALVLPGLIARMRRGAPGVTLTVLHMAPERALRALETDQLDFAVSMGLAYPDTVRAESLMQDRMCCAMGAGHPLAAGPLTLEGFLSASHLKVSMSPTDARFVDGWLAERGHRRKVALNVPNWMLVPRLVREGTLLAVVSQRFAALHHDGIVVRPLPFASPPFDWMLYWHRRNDRSPPQRWMREEIVRSCAELRPPELIGSRGRGAAPAAAARPPTRGSARGR
jgi:DNA-binding transcriptional LysR family regulator